MTKEKLEEQAYDKHEQLENEEYNRIVENEKKEIQPMIADSIKMSENIMIMAENILSKAQFTDKEKNDVFQKLKKVQKDTIQDIRDSYVSITNIPEELQKWIIENLTQEFKDKTIECDIKYTFCKIKSELEDNFLEEMKSYNLVNIDNDLTTKGFLYILKIMKK